MAGCAPKLATLLDQERIELVTPITSRLTDLADLPLKTGVEVSREIGGRFLLRYVRASQLGKFTGSASGDLHYVTPTPYGPMDAVRWLFLPGPAIPPTYVLMIDPSAVDEVLGPRWVRTGGGIEYLLPKGFPARALVTAWEMMIT